jgi:hypothetical protein
MRLGKPRDKPRALVRCNGSHKGLISDYDPIRDRALLKCCNLLKCSLGYGYHGITAGIVINPITLKPLNLKISLFYYQEN